MRIATVSVSLTQVMLLVSLLVSSLAEHPTLSLNNEKFGSGQAQRQVQEEEDPTEEAEEATAYGDKNNVTNNVTLVPIDCSSNLREFTATTEMVLTGSSDMLPLLDRKVLKTILMGVYNDLTTIKCDLYHRKLSVISFLEQRNNLGEVYTFDQMVAENTTLLPNETAVLEDWSNLGGAPEEEDGPARRRLQERDASSTAPSTAPTSFNESAALGSQQQISITYQITGTCRDCPVSESGAFQLYDDAFRRSLRTNFLGADTVRINTRLLQINDVELGEGGDKKNDCVCLEGVEPTPQAPGVQECVDLMNEELPKVQEELGVLPGLRMEDLLQLDDLTTVGEEQEEEDPAPTTNMPTEKDNSDLSMSTSDPDLLNIWGRRMATFDQAPENNHGHEPHLLRGSS